MSVASILERGRRRREALMRSQCRITRETGSQAFNPATGLYESVTTTVMYEGKCELQHAYAPSDSLEVTADASVQNRSYELVLPFGSPEVHFTDLVEVTSSDNQWVVGAPLRVVKVDYGSNRTAQHVALLAQDAKDGSYGGYA